MANSCYSSSSLSPLILRVLSHHLLHASKEKCSYITVKTHPEMGYKSLADFVTDSIREKCEELKILTPEPDMLPVEHFNISENGVRILDRTLANGVSRGRIIDFYFKPDKVWCEHYESTDCSHVKFALNIPEVQKILRKKGWKIRE